MSLSIDYIEKVQDSKKLSKDYKEVITILLTSINDWPQSIKTLEDFETQISNLVGNRANMINLKGFLSKIDFAKYAWEAESISQLLDVYNYYGSEKYLKEIIDDLQTKLKLDN